MDYTQLEGINFSLLKHVKTGPRALKAKIDQYGTPKVEFKTFFDFGNAYEDALLHNEEFKTSYGFVEKAPDASGKYVTYGRIIAEALILKQLENKVNGINTIDADWLIELKNRALVLSTLAGDIEKADKKLEEDQYKTYFDKYINFSGRVTDSATWATLEELIKLSNANFTFSRLMKLPRTEQEVLVWEEVIWPFDAITGIQDQMTVKCKGRADVIALDHEYKIIWLLDLKSTAANLYDGEFERYARRAGYPKQLQGYSNGIRSNPKYAELIADGYQISCGLFAGCKTFPYAFGFFPIEFHTDDIQAEIIRELETFKFYESNGFKDIDTVASIIV